MAVPLLIADFLDQGRPAPPPRFLSEKVLMTFVYGVAAEVVATLAAVTCVALWKRPD
jgi:hypothetical protein